MTCRKIRYSSRTATTDDAQRPLPSDAGGHRHGWPVRHSQATGVCSGAVRHLTRCLAAAASICISIAGCGSSTGTEPTTATAAPTSSNTDVTDPPAAVAECRARPAPNGDILVRETRPGLPDDALELGGGWQWNYNTNTCMTSVGFTIATASQGKGNCTEVALASGNLGYNVEAKPAAPLKKVIASACH